MAKSQTELVNPAFQVLDIDCGGGIEAYHLLSRQMDDADFWVGIVILHQGRPSEIDAPSGNVVAGIW